MMLVDPGAQVSTWDKPMAYLAQWLIRHLSLGF